MTWGEFKAAVEEQGVVDEDDLDYIDVSPEVRGFVVQRRSCRADDVMTVAVS